VHKHKKKKKQGNIYLLKVAVILQYIIVALYYSCLKLRCRVFFFEIVIIIVYLKYFLF
jgi:hypothetical protein